MKTRISICIASLLFVWTSAQAWAGPKIAKNKLLGAWSGQVIVHFHGQTKTVGVDMTFHKDGKVTVAQDDSGKVDEAKFTIEGDKVLIADGEKQMYLTQITLTESALTGKFEPANEASKAPPGVSIELSLTRGKGAKGGGDKAKDAPTGGDKPRTDKGAGGAK